MGVYSTMAITREDCLNEIRMNLDKATDDQLEEVLFDLVGEKSFHNFTIVSRYEFAKDFPFRYREVDPDEKPNYSRF